MLVATDKRLVLSAASPKLEETCRYARAVEVREYNLFIAAMERQMVGPVFPWGDKWAIGRGDEIRLLHFIASPYKHYKNKEKK